MLRRYGRLSRPLGSLVKPTNVLVRTRAVGVCVSREFPVAHIDSETEKNNGRTRAPSAGTEAEAWQIRVQRDLTAGEWWGWGLFLRAYA